MLRIIFMGSPEFAVPSLVRLAGSGHEILAVVSNPDRRRGRGTGLAPTPVKETALRLGLPVLDAESVRDTGFIREIKTLSPDLIVVVAFRILPPDLLEIPRLGSVNLHASLLPAYRGAAPIHRAIMNGEKRTGCTVFFLNESVDSGSIIHQEEIAIGPDETTGEVYDRLKDLGAGLLLDAVNRIESGDISLVPQDDSQATLAPKLYREDACIDFTRPSADVHNVIRGLSPYPVAWTEYKGEKLNLYRSRLGPDLALQPGELALDGERLLAGCGEGTVELVELQLPGRNRMSGIDFANGYGLEKRLG